MGTVCVGRIRAMSRREIKRNMMGRGIPVTVTVTEPWG